MRSNRALKVAIAFALAAASNMALAADNAAAEKNNQLDTVVVTGSYIRGTATDAALPVSVITSEDMAKQGSPSTLDLIKNLSASAGVLGDTDQFDARGAQGTEGSGSVNLRGLGPQRTLVLLNGRRLINNPLTGAVDTNTLPMFAIDRVEVLKDGAAATYGSDAIAGVVNFITKKKLQGLDLTADYTGIKGSSGDYDAGGSYGFQSSNVDFMISLGYEHRSELQVTDRDWAHLSQPRNPQGGWSGGGNPAGVTSFSAISSTPPAFVGVPDPSCPVLGGIPSVTAGFIPGCVWQYTLFDNLVEEQNRFQAYAELNVRFGQSMEWHTEAMYARTDVPHYKTSPSYLSTQAPTSASDQQPTYAGYYYIPPTNPGLVSFINQNPATASALSQGALLRNLLFRPFAQGGNPIFDYSSSEAKRVYDTIHVSTGLRGDFSDTVSYDVAVTYSSEKLARDARDTVVDRFQLALEGLGGPGCDAATGTPGAGNCSYYNPFGNAIPGNPVTGVQNPNYDPAVSNNNAALINWFFPKYNFWNKEAGYVVDAVVNGKMGLSLPGGKIGWAVGSQYRKDNYTSYIDPISNLDANPCVDSYDFPSLPCNASTPSYGAGVFMFLGGAHNLDLSQKVYALFGELSLPITESLQGQLAARYEKYDQGVGSTFNPKLALRWQVVDALAFRGSVGTTFRGPPEQDLAPGSYTTLQNISGTFRPIDTFGNPDLKPETALTFNLGALVNAGGFSSNLDYWSFKFDKPIVVEPLAGMVSTLFGTPAGCTDAAYADLRSRFTFSGACAIATVARVRINYINGSTTRTSGVDFGAKYVWDHALGGEITAGVDGTFVLKYDQDALSVGGQQVQAASNAVGLFNVQTTAYPLPKWRGSVHGDYSIGASNLRLVMNYIHSYEDARFNPGIAGQHIPSWVTWDAHYNLALPSKTTLTFSVENITDRDPPFVRAELNYDTFTANPLGRTYKLTMNQKF